MKGWMNLNAFVTWIQNLPVRREKKIVMGQKNLIIISVGLFSSVAAMLDFTINVINITFWPPRIAVCFFFLWTKSINNSLKSDRKYDSLFQIKLTKSFKNSFKLSRVPIRLKSDENLISKTNFTQIGGFKWSHLTLKSCRENKLDFLGYFIPFGILNGHWDLKNIHQQLIFWFDHFQAIQLNFT